MACASSVLGSFSNLQTEGIQLVVALDVGTTHAGIAWSLCSDFEKYPLRITSLQWPTNVGASQTAYKTPSVLLVKSNGEFVAFGYDAEEKYSELANDDAHYGYYFFKDFKMALYENEKLRSDHLFVDAEGHAMKTKDIFGHIIRYMKQRLLDDLKTRGNTVKEDNILWVVTVPAIWNDGAKQFMREAALAAGISEKRLRLALEPEAASIYTREILLERSSTDDQEESLVFKQGMKYIVIDLGGGTIDFTLKEVVDDNTIKDFHQATGGPWGGRTVNRMILDFLEDLLGKDVLEELKTNHKSSWLELEREVELKKKNAKGDKDGRILIQMPGELLDVFEKKTGKKLINSTAFESKYAGKIDIKGKKLRIDKCIVESCFKKCLEDIIQHTKSILEKPEAKGTQYIILVGGFAESEYMKTEMPKAFEDFKVFIPDEPWLAVMRGAVMFGQRPSVVESRIARYTYGIATIRFFLKDFDNPKHRIYEDNVPYCRNVFDKLAEVGQSFRLGETVTTEVFAHKEFMSKMKVKVFRSTEKDPRYVTDESCTAIGEMLVAMPGYGKDRKVTVYLCFGEEEITCSGINESNESVHVKLNLLADN